MRVIFISFILMISCNKISDKEIFLQYLKVSSEATFVKHESAENSIKRFDNFGYLIDKHWFNKKGDLYLYTFYNRFQETDNAFFKATFNKNNEILNTEGNPFYVSSNLSTHDSIQLDTVKAYMYLSNSPFLNPKVRIKTHNLTKGNHYLVEKKDPSYFIYFEDYIEFNFQEMEYTFFYETDNILLKDSLVYKNVIKRN